MCAANTQISMNVKMTRSRVMTIAILATAISLSITWATTPVFATTTGPSSPSTTPGSTTAGGSSTMGGGGGGGDFAEFMQCLFSTDGGSVSAADISNALQGPGPTEAEVTACYEPTYGSGGGADEAASDDGGEDEEEEGGGGGAASDDGGEDEEEGGGGGGG
jgi:hypothetical protein